MPEQPSVPKRHEFRIKGQNAERLLHQMANQTFLTDWCYPNPTLPSGKEHCDLLVVFDTTAIIWQAKSLKIRTDGTLRQSEIEKNLRQLSGARRQLFDLKTPLTLQNSRRIPERFDPSSIEDVFLISVLLGETPDFQSLANRVKSHQCHVFTREFTEVVFNELDTITDFCAYLREKERIRSYGTSFMLGGGEAELLGSYLLNGRSLARFEGTRGVLIEEGTWDSLVRRPEYRSKQEANKISYLWDYIVERAHTGDSPHYERIARELARPSRFERRCLAQWMYDAQVIAHENATPNGIFRRVFDGPHATICCLFVGDEVPGESRRVLLEQLCFVARGMFPQKSMVLGIATEMEIRRESSLDYCLLEIPEWGAEQQREMQRIQDKTGTLTNATEHETVLDEYPGILQRESEQ